MTRAKLNPPTKGVKMFELSDMKPVDKPATARRGRAGMPNPFMELVPQYLEKHAGQSLSFDVTAGDVPVKTWIGRMNNWMVKAGKFHGVTINRVLTPNNEDLDKATKLNVVWWINPKDAPRA